MMVEGRRPRSLTAAWLVLAFAAGATAGVAADRVLAPEPTVRTRVIRDLSGVMDGLGLTPDQRIRVEAILEASAPRSEEAMREAAGRLREVADSVDAQLRAILTPEQRTRLDRLRRQPVFMLKRKAPGEATTVDTVRPDR
jgi:Spy/CpxP family protein refolding chaperone